MKKEAMGSLGEPPAAGSCELYFPFENMLNLFRQRALALSVLCFSSSVTSAQRCVIKVLSQN